MEQQLEQRLVHLAVGRCCLHGTGVTDHETGALSSTVSCFLSSFPRSPLCSSTHSAQMYLDLSLFTTHPAASVLVTPRPYCGFCKPPGWRWGDVFVTATQSPDHVHRRTSDQGSGSQRRTSDGQATPCHLKTASALGSGPAPGV